MTTRATVATSQGFGLAIYGLNDVKRALKSVAPDLRKEMDNEIRDHIRPVQSRARSLVPTTALSRWNDIPGTGAYTRPMVSPYGQRWDYDRLRFDPSRVRSGIAIRQGGRRARGRAVRAAWKVINRTPAGAVFELAGSGQSNHPFVQNLEGKHGQPSRLIWRAWDEVGQGIDKKIAATVDKYERQLQQRIDAADDRSA